MMSIQFLTRNLRRMASLRGFSSVSVSEKPETSDKSPDSAKPKSSKSSDLFDKIKSVENTAEKPVANPVSVKAMPKNAAASKTKFDMATHISKAATVNDLLQLSEKSLNKQNSMAILTKLSVWTASNRVNVKEFENDYRFLKICSVLSKMPVKNDQTIILKDQQKSAELEMVLSIAGDDEASKIVESLSLSQKVRVFASLARKKSRSIMVLKTLASTISAHPTKLNLKECSDLLFAMASLNFIDEVLLARIAIDINGTLDKNQDKTAVVGSIVTSIGFLKYKEPTLLDNLTKWVIDKQEMCRSKDLASLILTLALVNYRPKHIDDFKSKVLPKIHQDDLAASEWLDYVWALSVLELHEPKYLDSVLRPEFHDRLKNEQCINDVLPAQKMKLLNVNAVAKHLTTNYDGPFLKPESTVNNCPFGYRKSKKNLIQGLQDTLKNLFTDSSYVRTEHDTKLGFVIDTECVLNENRVPLSVESENKDAFRVAFMILDYHDMCKGLTNDPNGFNAISFKLLRTTGYNVLQIPHTEFNTSDKVLKRVQYLDSKLKDIVKQSNKGT